MARVANISPALNAEQNSLRVRFTTTALDLSASDSVYETIPLVEEWEQALQLLLVWTAAIFTDLERFSVLDVLGTILPVKFRKLGFVLIGDPLETLGEA